MAARGSVPPVVDVRMKSISMDIGSSATRYGYFDNPKTFRGNEFKSGAKTAQTEITAMTKGKPTKTFRTAAADWKKVHDEAVRKLANDTPPLKNHERYYLLGGTPWVITVLSHPQDFGKAPDERPEKADWLSDVDESHGDTLDWPERPEALKLLDQRPAERERARRRVRHLFPRPETTEWGVAELQYDRRRARV